MNTIQISAIDMNKLNPFIIFDCLHDKSEPDRAAAHLRQSVSRDGVWLIIEPFAND
jgi:hypothetical protein